MTKKLPARALFYAVVVAVFVALISSSLLLASYHQHLLMGYYQTQGKLIQNCQSGVELILGSTADSIPLVTVDLFDKQRDSICLEQKVWGLLDVAFVKSWASNGMHQDSICKSFFVGKKAPDYALKLSEGSTALSVCGTTELVGDVYLPREGIERGFIQGKPYRGEKLVYGNTKIVELVDNQYLKARFEQLNNLKNSPSNHALDGDSLIQSFGQPTVVLSGDQFNTASLFLKGNVLIIASQRIVVSSTSVLEDVVLIAPEIIIQTGFQGNLQAFAWDSLVVEQHVLLSYPSVLGLLPTGEKLTFSPSIRLQAFSQVMGVVIVPSFMYSEFKARVEIETDAVVTGQVWVNGLLQHNGRVYGSVFCDKFLLKTAAAIYENYLLDAVIDRTKLSSYYLAPSILGEPSNKAILKELE